MTRPRPMRLLGLVARQAEAYWGVDSERLGAKGGGKMGCCKCEEYNWPDPQEIVWKDPADGKEYCVFHAPTAKSKFKRLGGELHSQDSFNSLVYNRFFSAHDREAIVNCSGTVFPWDIHFDINNLDSENPGVNFYHAEFSGNVVFSGLSINGHSNFTDTVFSKDLSISFVTFAGRTIFEATQFHGTALFWLCQFNSDTIFSRCIVREKIRISESFIKNLMSFIDPIAQDKSIHLSLIGIDYIGLLDRNITQELGPKASLQNINIASQDVHIFVFRGCQWPDRLWSDIHTSFGQDDSLTCQELYRSMKQLAAEEHDQPQVSRWHFREKLMQLKGLLNNKRSNDLLEVVEDRDATLTTRGWAWFKLLALPPYKPKVTLTGLYWATSGFGERAVRAGMWLLALVVLSFVANSIKEPWIWAELPGSAAAQYTMATIPFAKDIPGDGWVKVGRGFWQFLIAVQFTLFALALRNRFRR